MNAVGAGRGCAANGPSAGVGRSVAFRTLKSATQQAVNSISVAGTILLFVQSLLLFLFFDVKPQTLLSLLQ